MTSVRLELIEMVEVVVMVEVVEMMEVVPEMVDGDRALVRAKLGKCETGPRA